MTDADGNLPSNGVTPSSRGWRLAMSQNGTLGRLFAQSGWTLAGSIITATLGFAATALVPRLLGPSLVGVYFLTLSLTSFATVVGLLGMPLAATRLVSESIAKRETGWARATIRRGATLGFAGTGLVAILCVAGGWSLVAKHVFSSPNMAAIAPQAAVWIVVPGAMAFAVAVYRGLQQQAIAAVFDGPATNALYVAALVAMVVLGAHPTLGQVFITLIVAGGVALIPAVLGLAKHTREFARRTETAKGSLLGIGVPVMLISLMTNVVVGSASDLWVLGAFRPASSVALYGAAVRITSAVGMPFTALTVAIGPTLAALAARAERKEMESVMRSATTVVFLPTALVVGLLCVTAGPLLSTVFGTYYGKGAWILVALCIAAAINAITGPWGMALIMTGNQRLMLGLTALTGAVGVGADIVAAPRYGAVGVAVASSTAVSVMHLIGMCVARKRLGVWAGARVTLTDVRRGVTILRSARRP